MDPKELKNAYQRAYMKKYRAENKDKLNRYQQQWRVNNPDKVKKYNEDYWKRKLENMPNEQRAMYLRECGLSIREIAKELNISKSSVARYVNGTMNGQ